jgi:hypothetical protein
LAHSQHNLRIFPNLSYFIQQEIRMSLTWRGHDDDDDNNDKAIADITLRW